MRSLKCLAGWLILVAMFPLDAYSSPAGKFVNVQGRVDITTPGQAARLVIAGEDVHTGDIIRTKSSAKASVEFADGSILRVAEKTRVEITEYLTREDQSRGTLRLFRGKIFNMVKKIGRTLGQIKRGRFEVHTPTAVVGVRGTEFFTYHQEGISGAIFKEGKGYCYATDQPDMVRDIFAGQSMIVSDAFSPPVIRPVTELDIQKHTQEMGPSDGPGLMTENKLSDRNMAVRKSEFGRPISQKRARKEGHGVISMPTREMSSGEEEQDLMSMFTREMSSGDREMNPEGDPNDHDPSDGYYEYHMSLSPAEDEIMGASEHVENHKSVDGFVPEMSSEGYMLIGETLYFEGHDSADGFVMEGMSPAEEERMGSSEHFEDHRSIDGFVPEMSSEEYMLIGETLYFEGHGSADGFGTEKVSSAEYVLTDGTFITELRLSESSQDMPWISGEQSMPSDSSHHSEDKLPPYSESFPEKWVSGDLLCDIYDLPQQGREKDWVWVQDYTYAEWADGEIAAGGYMAWADLSRAVTGVAGGELIGMFDPVGQTWQTAQILTYMDTNQFLDMTGTRAGRDALSELNIPCVEIGKTSLSGTSRAMDVHINDVTFFGYSTGDDPRIWATSDVSGTYREAPGAGHTVNLSGGGLNADFNVIKWEGNTWGAGITGEGTLTRTDVNGMTDTYFEGNAAGTYTGASSGNFSGTGAGIANP